MGPDVPVNSNLNGFLYDEVAEKLRFRQTGGRLPFF